jgi:hypothetical protein
MLSWNFRVVEDEATSKDMCWKGRARHFIGRVFRFSPRIDGVVVGRRCYTESSTGIRPAADHIYLRNIPVCGAYSRVSTCAMRGSAFLSKERDFADFHY